MSQGSIPASEDYQRDCLSDDLYDPSRVRPRIQVSRFAEGNGKKRTREDKFKFSSTNATSPLRLITRKHQNPLRFRVFKGDCERCGHSQVENLLDNEFNGATLNTFRTEDIANMPLSDADTGKAQSEDIANIPLSDKDTAKAQSSRKSVRFSSPSFTSLEKVRLGFSDTES